MKWLPFVLLVTLACAKAPATRRPTNPAPACEAARSGVEDGALPVVGGPDTSDANATGGFALVRSGSCRRLELDLGNSARAGAVGGSMLRSYGIVRLELPALSNVATADTALADSTVAGAYVVHALDGSFHLDLHLARPAKALAWAGPHALGLELAPGGGAIPGPAARARNVVVLEPRGGGAHYPLTIRGYARTFEANVQAWITRGDSTFARTHATAADWSSTWGEFTITIPSGPSGDLKLFVGEESAQDGTPIGVTIPLRMP
jgi:hypothetical protein